MSSTHRALVTREHDGAYTSAIETRTLDDLPAGEVTVAVSWSSLNYKDMLSATGHRGITRKYPHVPGIDAAGVVVESSDPSLPIGTDVVVFGFDLGMNTSGGFGQRIRVPASWVLRRPEALSARDAMRYGTAGITACLSVDAVLASRIAPDAGDVLVTGASGGVGSIALAMLARRGFRVVAVSRRPEAVDFLRGLGAADVITPEAVATSGGKALAKERWVAAVDTVGGELLFEIVKSTRYGGTVTACGMSAGVTFAGNVYPFILRGVRLVGIDSVELPRTLKQATLDRLGEEAPKDPLDRLVAEVSLDALPAAIERMRAGKVLGRIAVNVGG